MGGSPSARWLSAKPGISLECHSRPMRPRSICRRWATTQALVHVPARTGGAYSKRDQPSWFFLSRSCATASASSEGQDREQMPAGYIAPSECAKLPSRCGSCAADQGQSGKGVCVCGQVRGGCGRRLALYQDLIAAEMHATCSVARCWPSTALPSASSSSSLRSRRQPKE